MQCYGERSYALLYIFYYKHLIYPDPQSHTSIPKACIVFPRSLMLFKIRFSIVLMMADVLIDFYIFSVRSQD